MDIGLTRIYIFKETPNGDTFKLNINYYESFIGFMRFLHHW